MGTDKSFDADLTLLQLLVQALEPLGVAVSEGDDEGTTRLFDCTGPDDATWAVWLAPNDGKSNSFAAGTTFLLGYRGTPPPSVFVALKGLAEQLRELEQSIDTAPWFVANRRRAERSMPTLIYGETRLEMRLTLRCNEKCLFCNSVELAENLVPDLDEALALLSAARNQGARLLVLTGGEPLLVTWLPDVARRARELGFERITIQSNGVLLDQDPVWQRLLATAPDELLLSVHGSDDDVVAAVSGLSGLFARKLSAIERCVQAGYRVAVSFVLCRQNMAHAAATMETLAALQSPPEMVAFSFVAPSGAAARAGTATIPSMTLAAPHLLAGLRRARELDLAPVLVEYCGMPTCIEPSLREFSEPFDQDHPLGVPPDKTKVAVCRECCWNFRCSGIFKGYLDLYGDEEISNAPTAHRRDCP